MHSKLRKIHSQSLQNLSSEEEEDMDEQTEPPATGVVLPGEKSASDTLDVQEP